MNNRYTIILTLVFGFLSLLSHGQNKKLKKANQKYDQFEYIDATEIYQQVAESGFTSEELLRRLSNGLFFNSKYEASVKWFEKLYDLKNGKLTSKELLRYAQSLRSVGKEEEAKRVYNEFLKTSAVKENDFLSAADYLEIIEENSNRYQTDNLNINSKHIDFGTHLLNDTIYFSSTRGTRRRVRRIDTWTNEPFLDIYWSVFNTEKKKYSKPKLIKGAVNSKHHESTPVITKDGNTMYFTRSNDKPLYDNEKNPIAHLKIYKATKDAKGNWRNIQDLSINGEDFSNAHPVLSPLENKLYFVSNRPEGKGETDIYSVDIFESGKLGQPENLGPKVNTSGRESFPFISKDHELYFSSDGHFGLGGYDVFYIDLKSKDKQLLNVGKPINGEKDDYAFSINNISKKGFFTSNRSTSDNIYSVLETKPIQNLLKMEITGDVIDDETEEALSDFTITVRDENNKVIETTKSDKDGKFKITVNKYKSHTVRVESDDYSPDDIFIPKKSKNPKIQLKPKKNIQKIEDGIDIASILNIVIYFDFDQSEIREDAKVELEKVVVVLKKYPTIKIDLKAHTDSKGEDNYNVKLSQRRADASMNYLLNKGISKDRLTAKGFGERQIINKCVNKVKCSEEEHQLNRRTEFIIQNNK